MNEISLKAHGKITRTNPIPISMDLFEGYIKSCVDEENAKILMDKEKFLEWLTGYSMGNDSYIFDGIFEEIENGTFDIKQGDEI